MNILIIGFGNMGKLHYKKIKSIDDEIKISILDPKIKDFNEDVKIIDDINTAKNYEAVIISTPTESHIEYLKKALKLTENIFIEKPICSTKQDFEIYKQLNFENKFIYTGLIEMHNLIFEKAETYLTEKPIGIEIFRHSPSISSSRITEDAYLDLAAHDLSVLFKFFIDKTEIEDATLSNKYKNNSGFFDFSFLNLETSETHISISCSRTTHKKIRFWRIITKNETVEIDILNNSFSVLSKINENKIVEGTMIQEFNEAVVNISSNDPALFQMREFLQVVKNKKFSNNMLISLDVHEVLFGL